MMMLPELISEKGFVLEGFLTSCSFNYLSRDLDSRVHMFILFVGGFGLPVLILCVFYSLMFYELKTKKKNLIQSFKIDQKKVTVRFNSEKETGQNVIIMIKPEHKNQNKIKTNEKKANCASYLYKRETKAARSSILIIFLFCIAWLPYAVITLFAQFGTNIEDFINPYSTSFPAVFAKLSAISDPLVYTLSNKICRAYFKSVFKKVFCLKLDKKNQ